MTDVLTRPVEATQSQPTVSRRRRFWASDWTKTGALVFGWHTMLVAVAMLFQSSQALQHGYPPGMDPNAAPLSHLMRFDGVHFHEIASGGYGVRLSDAAFYPLFPMTVRLVHFLSFGQIGFLGAAMIVNFVASWFAVVALLKIARHFFAGRTAQWLVVGLFLTAPTAYFLHVMYSEAMFCAFGFWAYLFALRRQWAWMGLCLIPLTASRITAALFIGLCFLEFFRAKQWRWRGLLSWHLLWFPAAYLGLALFALHLQLALGRPTLMFEAYSMGIWPYHQFDPNFVGTILGETGTSLHALRTGQLTNWNVVSHIIPLVGLAVLAAVSVYLLVALRDKGVGLPLGLFGLASVVMFTLNSNLVSVHRYVLPCLVVYIGLVLLTERKPQFKGVVYGLMFGHVLVFGFLYSMFVAGSWSG